MGSCRLLVGRASAGWVRSKVGKDFAGEYEKGRRRKEEEISRKYGRSRVKNKLVGFIFECLSLQKMLLESTSLSL